MSAPPLGRPPGQINPDGARASWYSGYALHDRMTHAFEQLAQRMPAAKIVDGGAGRQPYRELAGHFGFSYTAIDLPESIASGYAPPGTLAFAPDGRWPLEDGACDCVLSTQVLEHVRDLPGYLGEARRVLRADGVLLLSTHGFHVIHAEEDYWRWTSAGLRALLEDVGFEVESVEPVLTSRANLVYLFSTMVLDPWSRRRFFGRGVRLLQRLLNALIQRLDRRGRGEEDQFPNIYLTVSRKP